MILNIIVYVENPQTKPIVTVCKDLAQYCVQWARSNYCHAAAYNLYMRKNCQRSCGFCS